MALLSPQPNLAEENRAAMERQLNEQNREAAQRQPASATRSGQVGDLQQQTRDATSGVLQRPGRGKRAGQWVNSGGEFNNLTQNEVYGRLRARQGGASGSGPGGGLRTGGLSATSGIDWLERGRPTNGSITPDRVTPPPTTTPPNSTATPPNSTAPTPPSSNNGIPDVLSRTVGSSSDAENKTENAAEGGVEEKPTDPRANMNMVNGVPKDKSTMVKGIDWGKKGPPAAPDKSGFVDGIDWSPVKAPVKAPSAPPVLANPQVAPAAPPVLQKPAAAPKGSDYDALSIGKEMVGRPMTPEYAAWLKKNSTIDDRFNQSGAGSRTSDAQADELKRQIFAGNLTPEEMKDYKANVPAPGAPPAPATPPVLAKPQAPTAAATTPTPVNPDPLAPAASNPYPARSFTPSPNPVLESAKAMLAKPRDLSAAANPAAFQEWRKTDPDAIANSQKEAKMIEDWNHHLGAVNKTKKAAEQNMRNTDTFEEAQSKLGMISIGSDQYNKTKQFADDSYKFNIETADKVAENLKTPGNRLYKTVPDVLEKPVRTEASISGERLVRDLANPMTGPGAEFAEPVRGSQAWNDRYRYGGSFGQEQRDLAKTEQPNQPRPVRRPIDKSERYKAEGIAFPEKVLPPAPASDDRSKKSPLTAPSNPLDPVKVSQNPRTRGIPPLGGSPTPPVLQKPTPPNNQMVVGNPANKRKANPLSNMLKGLV